MKKIISLLLLLILGISCLQSMENPKENLLTPLDGRCQIFESYYLGKPSALSHEDRMGLEGHSSLTPTKKHIS